MTGELPQEPLAAKNNRPSTRSNPASGRGDQSAFSSEAEYVISELTGVPLNPPGPNQQTIPGSGPGEYRAPDLKFRGRSGSVRVRGTIIEVKASTGKTFGDLSARARAQIEDAIAFAQLLREKAKQVKDPRIKASLEKAHVEVFSDLP
jgi:hypothetical protein